MRQFFHKRVNAIHYFIVHNHLNVTNMVHLMYIAHGVLILNLFKNCTKTQCNFHLFAQWLLMCVAIAVTIFFRKEWMQFIISLFIIT